MRITFLTHYPGRGGSTTLVGQLAAYFQSRKHEVSVLTGEDSPNPVLRHYVVVPRHQGGSWRDRIQDYLDAIEATHPDVVYTVSGREEYDVLRFLRQPRVCHFSSLEKHSWLDIPYRIKQLDGFAEAVTANTPDVLKVIRTHQRHPCKTEMVPYRIQPCFMAANDVSLLPDSNDNRFLEICFVGRLETIQKRVQWLPEIIQACRGWNRSIRWHIYGDGPWASEFRAAIMRLGYDKEVFMHDWMDGPSLARLLPAHDLFFLCSLWEGLPIAMVEAMLCGLACVVPAIPAGITYTLAAGGGWLYEAKSPLASVAALNEATSDRLLILQKKAKAQAIARAQYASDLVEFQLNRLETGLKELRFNGRSMQIDTAPKLRNLRWPDALWQRFTRLPFRQPKPNHRGS